jgi:hypothetical protein
MDVKPKSLKKKKNPTVDTEPTLNTLENGVIKTEGVDPLAHLLKTQMTKSECDYLINHGLGDKNHITFYRLVMLDPMKGVQTPQYRAYAGEILDKLLRITRGDNFMWNRLKTLLLQNYHGMVEDQEQPNDDEDKEDDKDEDDEKSNVSMSQIRSLMNKKV